MNGTTQTFLQDGDQVTFSGVCKVMFCISSLNIDSTWFKPILDMIMNLSDDILGLRFVNQTVLGRWLQGRIWNMHRENFTFTALMSFPR